MRVSTLQRIVSPSDFVDAYGQGALALCLFQPETEVQMAIRVQDRQHMGVQDNLPVLAAEETEGEANKFALIERAQENITRGLTCDGQGERQGVVIGQTPYLFFYFPQLG